MKRWLAGTAVVFSLCLGLPGFVGCDGVEEGEMEPMDPAEHQKRMEDYQKAMEQQMKQMGRPVPPAADNK